MNQKVVVITGIVLISLLIILSFLVDFEAGPSGEAILIAGANTGISVPVCKDSDSGMSYNNRGYVVHKYGVEYDTCTGDSRYVLEQYCKEDGMRGIMQYLCRYGCSNGACKTGGRTLGVPPEGSGVVS